MNTYELYTKMSDLYQKGRTIVEKTSDKAFLALITVNTATAQSFGHDLEHTTNTLYQSNQASFGGATLFGVITLMLGSNYMDATAGSRRKKILGAGTIVAGTLTVSQIAGCFL
jgi:hypothetical protein